MTRCDGAKTLIAKRIFKRGITSKVPLTAKQQEQQINMYDLHSDSSADDNSINVRSKLPLKIKIVNIQ